MEGGNKNMSPLREKKKKNADSLGFVHQTRIYTEQIFAFSMLIPCELCTRNLECSMQSTVVF